MIYFLDNNLSFRYADMLVALGEEVRALRREFPQNTPDEKWIPEIGARGWVLITGDRNIKWKPHQRRILEEAKITAFFLTKGYDSLLFWEQAITLLKAWPNIKAVAERKANSRTYLVQLNGKVEPV